jgi:hypothetical protein
MVIKSLRFAPRVICLFGGHPVAGRLAGMGVAFHGFVCLHVIHHPPDPCIHLVDIQPSCELDQVVELLPDVFLRVERRDPLLVSEQLLLLVSRGQSDATPDGRQRLFRFLLEPLDVHPDITAQFGFDHDSVLEVNSMIRGTRNGK